MAKSGRAIIAKAKGKSGKGGNGKSCGCKGTCGCKC
jgi:hypothetical protein